MARIYTIKDVDDEGEVYYHVFRAGGEGRLLDEKLGLITRRGTGLYYAHGAAFTTFAKALGYYRRLYGRRARR